MTANLIESQPNSLQQLETVSPTLCSIDACNDGQAIAIFLQERACGSIHTAMRYKRECQRFVLWLQLELKLSLKKLSLNHLHQYRAFLKKPDQRWQTPGLIAESPNWVPFPYRANNSTIDGIFSVLGSFLSFLHAHGYIAVNPSYRMRKLGQGYAKGHRIERGYTEKEWQFIIEGLKKLKENRSKSQNYYERMRYIITLAYGTALREHELCTHTHADLVHTDSGVALKILGKGSLTRYVVLNKNILQALARFRCFHGLGTGFDNEPFPLAPSINPILSRSPLLLGSNVTTRQVRRIYQQFIKGLIVKEKIENTPLARSLLQKSFHSLRHTSLTHLANQPGVDLEKVRFFAGHADINTTKNYVLTEFTQLARYTENHWLKLNDY